MGPGRRCRSGSMRVRGMGVRGMGVRGMGVRGMRSGVGCRLELIAMHW